MIPFPSLACHFPKTGQLGSTLSKIGVSRQLIWMQMTWTDLSGVLASNDGFFVLWTSLATKDLGDWCYKNM